MKPLLLALTVLLSSCASDSYKKPPMNAPSSDASIKLAEAADSVSRSLLELARIQAEATPATAKHLAEPTSFAMQHHATVDWSGPIADIVLNVAKASHYRLRILGKAPAIPLLVSVYAQDTPLGTILRNIDYQAGNKATIKVYAKRKLIELRYA